MIKYINYVDVEKDGKIYNVPFSCMDEVDESDFINGEFNLDKWVERTGYYNIKIMLLKRQLVRYKEDVEQVELFGMERSDYEEKKKMCTDIILELRELEKTLKE